MSELKDFLSSNVGMNLARKAVWSCTHNDFRGEGRAVMVNWEDQDAMGVARFRRFCDLDEASVDDMLRLLDAKTRAKDKVLVAMAIHKEQQKRLRT